MEKNELEKQPKKTFIRNFDKKYTLNGTRVNIRFQQVFNAETGQLHEERIVLNTFSKEDVLEEGEQTISAIHWYNPITNKEEIDRLKKAGTQFC